MRFGLNFCSSIAVPCHSVVPLNWVDLQRCRTSGQEIMCLQGYDNKTLDVSNNNSRVAAERARDFNLTKLMPLAPGSGKAQR